MYGLSKTSSYAILALACLDGSNDRWVLKRDIARCTRIPSPYLAKILLALKGLVEAKRGYRGGYRLSRPAEQISLLDVAEAVEGDEWLSRCLLGLGTCSAALACPAHVRWEHERGRIRSMLRSINLADVAECEQRLGMCLSCADGHSECSTVAAATLSPANRVGSSELREDKHSRKQASESAARGHE